MEPLFIHPGFTCWLKDEGAGEWSFMMRSTKTTVEVSTHKGQKKSTAHVPGGFCIHSI